MPGTQETHGAGILLWCAKCFIKRATAHLGTSKGHKSHPEKLHRLFLEVIPELGHKVYLVVRESVAHAGNPHGLWLQVRLRAEEAGENGAHPGGPCPGQGKCQDLMPRVGHGVVVQSLSASIPPHKNTPSSTPSRPGEVSGQPQMMGKRSEYPRVCQPLDCVRDLHTSQAGPVSPSWD